jgi:hypothetical protein
MIYFIPVSPYRFVVLENRTAYSVYFYQYTKTGKICQAKPTITDIKTKRILSRITKYGKEGQLAEM